MGVNYIPKQTVLDFTTGEVGIDYNPETRKIFIDNVSTMNEFGMKMGYKVGDILHKFNGKPVIPFTAIQMLNRWRKTVKEDDKLTITVLRKEGETVKKKKLSARVFKSEVTKHNLISFSDQATEKQRQLRTAWLKAKE